MDEHARVYQLEPVEMYMKACYARRGIVLESNSHMV